MHRNWPFWGPKRKKNGTAPSRDPFLRGKGDTLPHTLPPPAARLDHIHQRFLDPPLIITNARFPFKRNRLRCMRCVNENHKKRKRMRWQAANHGCHCFDRVFLSAGAQRLRLLRENFLAVFVYATQTIAFEWKPGLRHLTSPVHSVKRVKCNKTVQQQCDALTRHKSVQAIYLWRI